MGLRRIFKRTTPADIYNALACEIAATAIVFSDWLEETIANPPVNESGSLVFLGDTLVPEHEAKRVRQSVLIGAEAMYYLLYCVDHCAVAQLGAERRNTAFDKIAFLTVSTYASAFVPDEKASDRVVDELIDTLNRRQVLYGQCSKDGQTIMAGSAEFALAYHVYQTRNMSRPRDMTEVLKGNREVTEADLSYLPDPRTAMLIACFIIEQMKALQLNKRFKRLYALWVK